MTRGKVVAVTLLQLQLAQACNGGSTSQPTQVAGPVLAISDSITGFDDVRHAIAYDNDHLLLATPGAVVTADFETGALDTLGRVGEGPGEYRNPLRVGRVRGASVAVDVQTRRVVSWPALATLPSSGDVLFDQVDMGTAGVDSVGTVVGLDAVLRSIHPEPTVERRHLVRHRAGIFDTLAMVDVPGFVPASDRGPLAGAATVPTYAASDGWGILADGSVWVLRADSLRLGWLRTSDTSWNWLPPVRWSAIASDSADRVAFLGAKNSNGEDTVIWRPMARQMGAFRRVMSGEDGSVWAEGARHAGEVTPLRVWLPGRGEAATYFLPPERRLLAIGATSVFALHEDVDGSFVLERFTRLDVRRDP